MNVKVLVNPRCFYSLMVNLTHKTEQTQRTFLPCCVCCSILSGPPRPPPEWLHGWGAMQREDILVAVLSSLGRFHIPTDYAMLRSYAGYDGRRDGRWGGHKVVDFGAHLQRRAWNNFLGSPDMQLKFSQVTIYVPSVNS